MKREVRIEGKTIRLEVEKDGLLVRFTTNAGDAPREASILETEPGIYSVLIDGKSYRVPIARGKEQWLASVRGREYTLEVIDPRTKAQRAGGLAGHGKQVLSAPMPGKIVKRLVNEGDVVNAGQGVIVVEAMKMQNEMKAVRVGKVISLPVLEGATVSAGDTLAVIE